MTNNIKTPSEETGILTDWQAEEFIRCANSLPYFMANYVTIQNPSLGAVLFEPRPYQLNMINKAIDNRATLLLAPRQCGKSITVASLLLWYAIFQKDTKVGISSNKLANAKEIMSRIRYAYEGLPTWLQPAVKSYNLFSIVFDNGSSLEAGATTESGFRGKSFTIMFLDEFAHVKPAIAEEFWTSLLPTIMGEGSQSKTKVIITSTPNGTEGLFAQLWFGAVMGENGFAHYEVPYQEIPGRDEEFKQEMLKKMTLVKYQQEFECAFLSSKETLINSMVLESIKKKPPLYHMDSETCFWLEPEGRKIAVACDVGTGVGADSHVIQMFDIDTLEQLGEFKNNIMPQTEFTRHLIKVLGHLIDKGADEIYYTVEGNSYGKGVINLLENTNSEIVNHQKVNFVSSHGVKHPGILMTPKSKNEGCAKFKDLVERYAMKLHSEKLLTELKFFVRSGQTFKAETGMHDDIAMSCIILTLMLQELSSYEDTLYEVMNTIEFDLEDEGGIGYDPTPFLL